MALISCPECGLSVSDQAHACPHCGLPLRGMPPPAAPSAYQPPPPPPKKGPSGCAMVFLVVIFVGLIVYILGVVRENTTASPRGAALASPAAPLEPARWTLVGQSGDMRFVAIEAEASRDKSEYQKAVNSLCSGTTHCFVNFWDDPAKTPGRLPLSDAQVDSQMANYRRNTATGLSQWIWRCDAFPGSSPNECF